jgi:hypothetical protein
MMIRNYAIGTLALILVACASWMKYTSDQLASAHASERRIALKASNLEAVHDSTRNLARENARVAKLLGDSLRAYEKRVVQQDQPADPLDSAARITRSAMYRLGFNVGEFIGKLTKPRRDTVPFHIRQDPYTVYATVSHPPVGDSVTLAVTVALDTIPMTVRVGCRVTGDAGIRAASVMLTAPPWATVRFDDVQQDPGICNPSVTQQPPGGRRLFSWAPVALSVGRTIGPGPNSWTAQLGTAIVFGAR